MKDLPKDIGWPIQCVYMVLHRKVKILEKFESGFGLVRGHVWEAKWPALEAALLAWLKHVRSAVDATDARRFEGSVSHSEYECQFRKINI